MNKSKILILDTDLEFANLAKRYLESNSNFTVCAVSDNGKIGKELIIKFKPQIIIMDLLLLGEDGFSVLKYLKDNFIQSKVLIISEVSSGQIIKSAIGKGACFFMNKPAMLDNILNRCEDLVNSHSSENHPTEEEALKIARLDERISNIFISIGIPPHIKGYAYLREGVKIVMKDPKIINSITKKLYPEIAKRFDTTDSKVERAIRHSIEVAWNKGRIDAINAIFGVRVYIGNEKPTNSEFIALVADKLMLEDLR